MTILFLVSFFIVIKVVCACIAELSVQKKSKVFIIPYIEEYGVLFLIQNGANPKYPSSFIPLHWKKKHLLKNPQQANLGGKRNQNKKHSSWVQRLEAHPHKKPSFMVNAVIRVKFHDRSRQSVFLSMTKLECISEVSSREPLL